VWLASASVSGMLGQRHALAAVGVASRVAARAVGGGYRHAATDRVASNPPSQNHAFSASARHVADCHEFT
jgi:hypothetical protein